MEKHDMKMIANDINNYLQNMKCKNITIQQTLYNLVAIIDELGYLKSKPNPKEVEMELKGDTYHAKESS
jgi:cell division protein ZapA (FtsZ GTPase activity inhibitor)